MFHSESISFHVSFFLSGNLITITDGDEKIEMPIEDAKKLAEQLLKFIKSKEPT